MIQRSLKDQIFTQSEQDSVTPSCSSLEGQISKLPTTFPQLKKEQPSYLSRVQQLVVAQSQGIPCVPSYAGEDGLVLDSSLTSFGKQRWWSALSGRFKLQKLLRKVEEPSVKELLHKLIEPDNYSLCWRLRTTSTRQASLALSLETQTMDPIFQIFDECLGSIFQKTKKKKGLKATQAIHPKSKLENLSTRLRFRSKLFQHELTYNFNLNDKCQIGLNQIEKIQMFQTLQLKLQTRKPFNCNLGLFHITPKQQDKAQNNKHLQNGEQSNGKQEGSFNQHTKGMDPSFMFEQFKSYDDFGKTQTGQSNVTALQGNLGISKEYYLLKNQKSRLKSFLKLTNRQFSSKKINNQQYQSTLTTPKASQKNNNYQEKDVQFAEDNNDVDNDIFSSNKIYKKDDNKSSFGVQTMPSDRNLNQQSQSRSYTQTNHGQKDGRNYNSNTNTGDQQQKQNFDKQSEANQLMDQLQKVIGQIKSTAIPYPILQSDEKFRIDVKSKSPEEIGQMFSQFVNQQIGDFSDSLGVLRNKLDYAMKEVREGKLLEAINNLQNIGKTTNQTQDSQFKFTSKGKQLPMGYLFKNRQPQIKLFTGVQNYALFQLSPLSQTPNQDNVNYKTESEASGGHSNSLNISQDSNIFQQTIQNGVLRVVGSLGVALQYGKLHRKILDYTQASIRWDGGTEQRPLQRFEKGTQNPGDRNLNALLSSMWQSLTLSGTQQLYGPVRIFGDFRIAWKPLSNDIDELTSSQDTRDRAFKIAKLISDNSKQMTVFQQTIFGIDFVAPGGVGKLALWSNPLKNQTMLELRL